MAVGPEGIKIGLGLAGRRGYVWLYGLLCVSCLTFVHVAPRWSIPKGDFAARIVRLRALLRGPMMHHTPPGSRYSEPKS